MFVLGLLFTLALSEHGILKEKLVSAYYVVHSFKAYTVITSSNIAKMESIITGGMNVLCTFECRRISRRPSLSLKCSISLLQEH